MNKRSHGGFTLVELMITVAIVAVVATLAVNSYRRYMLRVHRTEATTTLLAIQTAQEKWFLQNNAYAQDIATLRAAPPAGLGINVSAGGVTRPGGWYTISFTAATATTYTVQAAATGSQTDDTICATFSIAESGVRTSAPSTTDCWR